MLRGEFSACSIYSNSLAHMPTMSSETTHAKNRTNWVRFPKISDTFTLDEAFDLMVYMNQYRVDLNILGLI